MLLLHYRPALLLPYLPLAVFPVTKFGVTLGPLHRLFPTYGICPLLCLPHPSTLGLMCSFQRKLLLPARLLGQYGQGHVLTASCCFLS